MANEELTSAKELPLVVVAGPTASGKTALAIKLASEHGGEIICADSRTVYRGMDIGTAKPSFEERQLVPHWGLDLVEPGERFTVADFKAYTQAKIVDIRSRGKIPFLVGGTGLYIDSVIFDFQLVGGSSDTLRQRFEDWSVSELQKYCIKNNISVPENSQNKRYIIRAIERKGATSKRRDSLIDNTFAVAVTTNRKTLRTRIGFRAEQLFNKGVVNEATSLGEKYGWESEAMTGNIYALIRSYVEDEIDLTELKRQNAIRDWQLAKRQMTWFRRNPYVLWGDLASAEHYLLNQLANI